jgi:L-ascorbate metabolism protein UlaG (beta-lactamase superfamily)
MKITKLGHCCLLIEENGKRIVTDPGVYSVDQNTLTNIDVIVITHDHEDHLHVDSLKIMLVNNPQAFIVTNTDVGHKLEQEGLSYVLLEHEQQKEICGVNIAGFGTEHALIYSGVPLPKNTGYVFSNSLYYPGDSFFVPDTKIDILALPVSGPWMKSSEAIDFAKTISPNIIFPVHDGFFTKVEPFHRLPQKILTEMGIEFVLSENPNHITIDV